MKKNYHRASGIVMQVHKNKATLLTPSGQFIHVIAENTKPSIGQEFAGEIYKKDYFYKSSLIAACLFLMILLSRGTYVYFTPTSSVIVTINPSVKLETNIWNKIIKVIPLNKDGEQLLKSLTLKNKSIDEGIMLVLEEAKKENFINDNYIKSNKAVNLFIEDSKENIPLPLSEAYAKKNHIKLKINENSDDGNYNGNKEDNKNIELNKKDDKSPDINIKQNENTKDNANVMEHNNKQNYTEKNINTNHSDENSKNNPNNLNNNNQNNNIQNNNIQNNNTINDNNTPDKNAIKSSNHISNENNEGNEENNDKIKEDLKDSNSNKHEKKSK